MDKHIAEFEKRRKQIHFKISVAPPVQLVLYLDKNKRQNWIWKPFVTHSNMRSIIVRRSKVSLRRMQAQQQDKNFLPLDLIYSCVLGGLFIFPFESGKSLRCLVNCTGGARCAASWRRSPPPLGATARCDGHSYILSRSGGQAGVATNDQCHQKFVAYY